MADPATSKSNQRNTALSRDKIVQEALKLVRNSVGGELSMRQLAQQLGVTPMAIYRYFSDKAELLECVLDASVADSEMTEHSVSTANWRKWLKESFTRLHKTYMKSPGIIRHVGSIDRFGPKVMRVQDDTLGVLLGIGLSRKDAVAAYITLANVALGDAIAGTVRERSTHASEASLAHLAAESGSDSTGEAAYANLRTCMSWLKKSAQRTDISAELDLVLDGIEKRIA